jgi:hypothetical protein
VDNRGKPAAVLITEPFIPTARAIAEIRALPEYPFAVLKHPIGSLNDDEVRQRAKEAVPRIIEILLGK